MTPDEPQADLEPEPGGNVFEFRSRRPAVKVRDAVGQVLREERNDQERTLVDVAEKAWVSVQYLSEIERGR